MIRDTKLIKRLSNWYFSKKLLPYWAVMLMDALIVFASAIFAYWAINRTLITFENRFAVLGTSLMYAVLSWVGAKVFKTYLGVLRYSSTIDLIKLAYANLTTLILALVCSLVFKWAGVDMLCALSITGTIVTMLVSTLLMWALRLIVKVLYEAVSVDTKAMRVLVFGTFAGGIGLAKYIRSQSPLKFELAGFISHEGRFKDMKLLGVKCYTLDDDIAQIIKKNGIQAVLVSPLRIDDFRHNQKFQDVLIGAGVRILMAQEVKEASIQSVELSEEEMHLKEVSVEDLLPRQEIKVDMKAVGEFLQGKCVLITGAAGSIGMEIVRQVAAFKPAKMILIDQAETPQHAIDDGKRFS